MSAPGRGGGCRNCERLRERVRVLEAELVGLRQRLLEVESSPRPVGWYRPSVKPVEERKKPGRKEGQCGRGRSRPDRVDQVVDLPLKKCPHCSSRLRKPFGVRSRFVWDVPPPSCVHVTEYRVHRYWCKGCKKNVEADSDLLPGFRLGVGVWSWVYVLHHQLNVSFDKIVWWMREVWQLPVTKSGLTQGLDGLAARLKPVYDGMVLDIRESPYSHVDETGCRVMGVNWWTWVFRTPENIVYHTAPQRSSEVPKDVLGEDYGGVVVSDNHSAYSPLPYHKQKCWVHIIRKARDYAKEFPDKEHKKLYRNLQRIYRDIKEYHLKYHRKPPPKTIRKKHYQRFRKRIKRVASKEYESGLCSLLAEEVSKRIPEYLTCIKDPRIPPHNNPAEQALRSQVSHRKNSSTRSTKSLATHNILQSLLNTQQQKTKNPLTATKQILQQINHTKLN